MRAKKIITQRSINDQDVTLRRLPIDWHTSHRPPLTLGRVLRWFAYIGAAAVVYGCMHQPAIAAELPTFTSAPGESQDAFLHRVGAQMRAWSDGTGFEACGAIAQRAEQLGVVVTTSRSHMACAVNHSAVPAGFTSTGETIHTHGTDRRFKSNAADAKLVPGIREGIWISGQHLDSFSVQDYLAPGYLAAPGGVIIHQHGFGTDQTLGATP